MLPFPVGHIFVRFYILYHLISQFFKANPFTKIKKNPISINISKVMKVENMLILYDSIDNVSVCLQRNASLYKKEKIIFEIFRVIFVCISISKPTLYFNYTD